jgi:hypothetical protein
LDRTQQPENDLHPVPARLAMEIQILSARLDKTLEIIECLASQQNMPVTARQARLARQ